ncbi:MAG: hypothetical protein RIF33_07895 [Cyclobacteriaceae bacterium]
MKSITVHNIDEHTAKLIEQKAKKLGLSLNKTIKALLHQALGVEKGVIDNQKSFEEFFGIWSEQDSLEFHKNTEDTRAIDKSDWS